jgi:hypothetical protein
MTEGFTHQFTHALREAIAQAVPDTPSGSHRILVIGQLVVNIHAPELPVPHELEHSKQKCSTR